MKVSERSMIAGPMANSGGAAGRASRRTQNWNGYRYVGRKPWYALCSAAGSGSAAMFGYQRTNHSAIAPRAPATNRRESRAVATYAATGDRARITTNAIG